MTYQFAIEPFPHQLQTFNETKDLASYAILWEQGCGKTKIAIDNACYLYEQGQIDAAIVVAPNGVHRNWASDELPKHVPDRLKPKLKAEFWQSQKSSTKKHQNRMLQLVKHNGFAWLLISYDAFMTDAGKKFVWKFLRNRRCFYVLDESHNIKNPAAKRTKSVTASTKYAPYKRILTGTPIATGPFDIYSQLKAIDENFWEKQGLGSFHTFKFYFGEWFTRAQAHEALGYDPGFDKLIEYKNIDQLTKMLASISSRVTKESAGLNIPPKLFTKRYCELTTLQKQMYEKVRDEFIYEFEDGAIVEARLAIVRLLRLQQIICGYVATDAEEPIKLIGDKNPRLALLEEITDSIPAQGIIWARFTKDIDQIMDMLGNKAVRYDGQISDDEAEHSKKAFQNGDVQWFVGNPQKGKEGLTFVNATHCVYYSNSFKLIDRLQSEDRCHRIGQKNNVTYYDICAAETVDEHIINSLVKKLDIASKITGDELRSWL